MDKLEIIRQKFPQGVEVTVDDYGEARISVQKERFPELMRFLHDDDALKCDLLIDIVGVDYRNRTPRFEILYVLISMLDYRRLIVRLNVDETDAVPTVTHIWKTADWQEREVYDMLGIRFKDHPDLRRILTWDDFDGHPLRKDFPLQGRDFDKKFDPDTIKVV